VIAGFADNFKPGGLCARSFRLISTEGPMKKSPTYRYFRMMRKKYPDMPLDMAVEYEIDEILDTEDLDVAEYRLLRVMQDAMNSVDSDSIIKRDESGKPIATRIFG